MKGEIHTLVFTEENFAIRYVIYLHYTHLLMVARKG